VLNSLIYSNLVYFEMIMKKAYFSTLLLSFLCFMELPSVAAPVIDTQPSSSTPGLNTTATLSASVTAEPGATYSWLRGATAIINGGRYSGAGTATLTITNANSADNGSYTLTVMDGTGTTVSDAATITVTQTPASLDPAYNGAGANGGNAAIYTNTALHLPDGRTLLAVKNQFNGVSGTATSNLVVMSATGVASHPNAAGFVGGSNGGDVTCLFRMDDGKILLGGDFTTHRTDTVVNTPRNKVARLNANLSLDTSFVPTGPSSKPNVIFADSYGRIYIGGAFTNYATLSGYNFLVRLKDDGSLDQSFKPFLNNFVSHVVLQNDGKFIVGGAFTSFGDGPFTSVPGLVRFLADGTIDTSFSPTFPSGYATQTSLATDTSDNLYIGRSGADGKVFKLLPDGSLVNAFAAPGLFGQINTIAALPDGKVAISGFFTAPTNRFMVLNADGSQDTGFNVGTGFNSVDGFTSIQSIVPDVLGRIWIMGINFSTYNGSAANRLAVLQGTGSPSLTFTAQPTGRIANQGTSVSFTAAASGNNGFTYQWQKNGSPLSNGGNVSGATTATLTLTNIQSSDEAAYSLAISSPGASSITSRVANLDVLGVPEITQDPVAQTVDFGSSATLTGTATGATPLAYQWYYGTTALVNGTGVSGATTNTLTLTNIDFNDAGQYSLKASNNLGDDTSASVILTVQKRPGAIVAGNLPTFAGSGYSGYVSAIQPLLDGSYIVGGAFEVVTINGVNTNRKGLVRIKADGTLDTSFPTVNSTNRPSVEAIVVDGTGRIFIGGDFTSVVVGATETPRLRVARLTPTFALDTAFNTSTVGPDKIVRALATAGDGSVYIGGEFTTIGTTAIRYMAKLTTAGARDAGFTNSISTGAQDNNKSVNSIVRLANGTLYVGSSVSFWGSSVLPGQPAGRLVKLSAAGGRDFGFASPDIFTIINAIIALPDGSLFAGGNPVASLKRRNGTTGADLGFTLPGHFIQTYALHRQADGKLLSGSYGVLKRTDSNLNVDTGFDIGAGFDQNYIRAINTDTNGRIYIGGDFSFFNGISRNRFVILNGGDLDSRTQPRQSQTLTMPTIADRGFSAFTPASNILTITLPTSSANLPVDFVVASGPATLLANKLTITAPGVITLTATQAGNDNYAAATSSVTFTVSKQSQGVDFGQIVDKANTSAPFLLSASASSGLPISYQVTSGPATVSGNVLTLTGAAGDVTILASQAGNGIFAAAADVQRTFTVFTGVAEKRPQVILFPPLPARNLSQALSFNLNASASSGLPLTFTSTGPVTSIIGNTVTLSGAAGSVTITAKQAGNANFLPATDVKQTFAVTAAATTLTLTNLAQTYTGSPLSIGTVGGSGTPVISYTIAGVKGSTSPTNAGTYPVEAVIGTGPSAVKKSGNLIINKAPLLVVADDQRKFITQINPALTFAYSGFVGSDNAGNAVSKAPTVTTTAKTTSPGGNYPITPAAGTSANYNFVYVKGNLKIESWAGKYEAIVTDANTNLPTGKVEFTVTPTSLSLSGKFFTAKHTSVVNFGGPLGLAFESENATANLTTTLGSGSTATLYTFDISIPLAADFSVTVTRQVGSGPVATIGRIASGKKLQLNTGKPPVSYAGAYTLTFAPDVTASTIVRPSGFSHATAAIDATGKMTFNGVLADGTKITSSLLPDSNAGYRLYLTPYIGRLDSYCSAWIEPVEHPDLPGRASITAGALKLSWAKAPKTTDANYKTGIPESQCTITMDPWLPPVAAKVPNSAITVAQRLGLNTTGDLKPVFETSVSSLTPGIPTLLKVDSKGLVTVALPATTPANQSGYTLTINPATGGISGSFNLMDGAIKRPVKFTGVMRKPFATETTNTVIGFGHAILPQLTGSSAGTTSAGISFEQP
jgi:uncharacterized delta-60 repeat protein